MTSNSLEQHSAKSSIPLGIALGWAAVCVLCFGSQSAHLKTKVVQRARAPWLMKLMFSIGVGAVGTITAIGLACDGTFPFTTWGAFTAWVWAPGTVLMLAATPRIGVGLTQGLVASFCSLTGFLTGVVVRHDPVPHVWGAAGAILLLLAGVTGLAMTFISAERRLRLQMSTEDSEAFEHNGASGSVDVIGIVCAVCAGVFYGCQGLLLEDGGADEDVTTMMLAQVPLIIMVVFMRALVARVNLNRNASSSYGRSISNSVLVPSDPGDAVSAGAVMLALVGGVLFGLGFVGQTKVLREFGDERGTPITQANLIVAGVWSVFVFREVHDKDLIAAFGISSAIALTGISLLAAVN